MIIADEITSALDVSVQGSVLNVLREVQRRLGLTMLFISHDFAVIRYVSDVIAVMYQGQIVEVADTELLLSAPQHPYTQTLLASVPRLGGQHGSSALAADTQFIDAPTTGEAGCAFRTRCPLDAAPQPAGDRRLCLEEDPQLLASSRRHRAACHFVTGVAAS